MALSAIPYALQNVTHNANLFRQAAASLIPPGGGTITANDFLVSQTGTPSMAVIVGVGRIWIPGTEVANVTGGNFSSQAMYYAENESADTRTVNTSDPTNPRIDVVYAYVKDQAYSGTQNLSDYAVATGTATPGATYPTNAPALPNNAVALAWINVPAGASSILNANITQLPGMIVGRMPLGQLSNVSNAGSNVVGTTLNNMLETTVYVGANRVIEVKATIDGSASVNALYIGYSLAYGGTGTGGTVIRTSTKAYATASLGEGVEVTGRYNTTAAGRLRFNLQGQVTITSGTVTATAGNTKLTITDMGAI